MTDRRRGLGRGLGALIPSGPQDQQDRPRDLFFPRPGGASDPGFPMTEPVSGSAFVGTEHDGFTGNITTPERADPTSSRPAPTVDTDSGETAPVAGDPGAAVPTETADTVAPGDDWSFDGDGLAPVPGARFAQIPVGQIRTNPRQPRQVFDEDELGELVGSITQLGVLQPVVVRPVPEDEVAQGQAPFELVMGERRLRASQLAGTGTIPAIVRATEDEHMLRDALLENLHRVQLNPLEEAAAYQQLLEDFGCTHDELATRIGRSRPQISNTIRLLKLPPLVQRRVASGVLSAGHARALLGLSDGAAMERLAQRIVAEGLSVRSVEEIVLLDAEGADVPHRRRGPRAAPAPELQDAADRLSQRLDTRVQVAMGRRKGRITVEFAGQDDLDRILDLLAGS